MASENHRSASGYSAFVPILLMVIAALLWSVFQWRQLSIEQENLQRTGAAQQQQVEQAKKLRVQLDSISSGMQKLADSGNATAKIVVEELRKRGVTINPNVATAAPAAPPSAAAGK